MLRNICLQAKDNIYICIDTDMYYVLYILCHINIPFWFKIF